MIMTAFDVKIHEKKDDIPPRARRPSKSKEKKQCAEYGLKSEEKTNYVDKAGSPPARPSARVIPVKLNLPTHPPPDLTRVKTLNKKMVSRMQASKERKQGQRPLE